MASDGRANPYPLRLPFELMEKFKIVANHHDRSVNAEIIQLVKVAVTEYESEHGTIEIEGDEG